MVDARRGLDPDRPTGEPQPQREVDVLLVEEEALGHPARLAPRVEPDREAGAGGKADLARREIGLRRQLAPRAARPREPSEVDHAALGVDDAAAIGSDEPHPRRPPTAIGGRAPDRVGEARRRDGVGIDEDQQLARGLLGAPVAACREAEVGACLDQPRAGRELGDDRGAVITRAVVDDDQLIVVAELLDKRRQ